MPPSPLKLPGQYTLRAMTLADVPQVMKIEVVACPAPWSEKGYKNEIAKNKMARYQVLEQAGVMIGYIGHWILVDECHISIVAVHPDQQGNGLGELLMLSALLIAIDQNAALATLEVRELNIVAQRLYEKLGFKKVGVRKRYYKDSGEDAFIMTVEPLDAAYRQKLHELSEKLFARLSNNTVS